MLLCVAGGKDLSGIKAVQWGIQCEDDAIKEFESQHDSVSNCGLVLHSCGYIGASPDGFVGPDGLIEVKCPYKARQQSIDDLIKIDKTFCLKSDTDSPNTYTLNQHHDYYHQVQGQLHICNKTICYFYVYSPLGSKMITVLKNMQWADNLDKLQLFYKENLQLLLGN